MILWTIFPPEMVWARQEEPPAYEEMYVQGVRLLAVRRGPQDAIVVRLLTTNPADYLNTSLQPGAVITLQPTLQYPV